MFYQNSPPYIPGIQQPPCFKHRGGLYKFIKIAQDDDVLIIKPIESLPGIVCALVKGHTDIQSDVDPTLARKMNPYFNLLKDNFSPAEVVDFLKIKYKEEQYVRGKPTIITQHLIERVKDSNFNRTPYFKKT